MKKLSLGILLFAFCLGLQAQVRTTLNIPSRIQWPNNDGYCGENSIQMCGLYYGNYISEGLCRRVAGGELLINVNDTIALEAFSFTYKEWNPNASSPQYSTYLDWVKQYLYKKQPVIITVYVSGLNDPDYDHIIPAIGFDATGVNTYAATDSLTYNSNFDTAPFTRVFSTLYGTRSVANNSAPFPYYIPKNVDYGVAVTGNKDPMHMCKPVHMVLDSNDEPNVSLGVPACTLKAIITADSLTPGSPYALLRFNNYLTVPSTGFSPAGADAVVYFTATATTHTVSDSFMSDTAVFYRCISYALTGMDEIKANNQLSIYPNPANEMIHIALQTQNEMQNTGLQITDVLGNECIQSTLQQGRAVIDVSSLQPGLYFIKTRQGTQKFIKQ
jgi:hypothetical protein